VLVLCFMVAYPFPSAATEALVECSTERVRRLSPISTPKDDTSAILAASPRIDTFSTWLLGATAGFLVLLVTNIERVINVIKTGPVRTIIVVLLVSAVIGLFQKVIALYFYVQTSIDEAGTRNLSEIVKVHSGEDLANPYHYLSHQADFGHFTMLLLSAFPIYLQRVIKKMLLSGPDKDLSSRQKDIKKLVTQFSLVVCQIMGLLCSVAIILFNL